jgi:hypothetical protein
MIYGQPYQGSNHNHSALNGPHSRRSGSSKPKKKSQQPIKIIKNINNNNFIFNNPQIEIKNPQVLGGSLIQTQNFNGNHSLPLNSKTTTYQSTNGVMIKDENIVMAGNMPPGFIQGT